MQINKSHSRGPSSPDTMLTYVCQYYFPISMWFASIPSGASQNWILIRKMCLKFNFLPLFRCPIPLQASNEHNLQWLIPTNGLVVDLVFWYLFYLLKWTVVLGVFYNFKHGKKRKYSHGKECIGYWKSILICIRHWRWWYLYGQSHLKFPETGTTISFGFMLKFPETSTNISFGFMSIFHYFLHWTKITIL